MKIDLDNPVIDKQEDGTHMYFHDLPPMLLSDNVIISQEDADFMLDSLFSLMRDSDETDDDEMDE